jgi:HEAT repeat protein
VLLVWLAAALATTWDSAFDHSDPRVRVQAYRSAAHERAAPEALERIAGALASESDADARAAGRDALARLDLDVAALADALATSEHGTARAWSAYALGHHPGTTSVSALLDAISDPNDAVRREVYDALGRLGDRTVLPALQLAASADPTVTGRRHATDAAVAVVRGRRDLDIETTVAQLTSGDVDQRIQAAATLSRSADWRAVDALIAASESGDIDVRRAAVLALGILGDQRAVPHLVAQFPGAVATLRYDLLAALARLGDESALPSVLLLLDHDDPATRQLAVRAAAWIAADDVVEAITPSAADPAEQVRTEVLLVLDNQMRGAARASVLAQMLADDPSPFLRAEAARVLVTVGGETAEQSLALALEDRDSLVRLAASLPGSPRRSALTAPKASS